MKLNTIKLVITKIALRLLPDSNHPLYPIPSIYVVDDVFVIIAIYIEIIYIDKDTELDKLMLEELILE